MPLKAHPKNARRYGCSLGLLLLSLLLFSCQGQPPRSGNDIAYGDTLVIGTNHRPSLLNPVLSISGISATLVELVFNGLTEVNARLEVEPDLASGWTISPDGRRWTFRLRRGVRFHDGWELTAEDVAFTLGLLNRYGTKTFYANVFQVIEAVRAQDRYTVEIDLSHPTYDLLYALNLGILPRHLLEGQDLAHSPFNDHPIGTGPFQVASWSEQEVVLKAHQGYFRGRPYLDWVLVRAYDSQRAAWARLLRGEIDFFYGFDPQSYRVIRDNLNFHVYSYLFPFYYFLALNLKNGLFRDVRVRQALNYAIDRQELIRQALQDRGRPASGPLYPASEVADLQLPFYPYDPRQALALLKEAGWEDRDGDGLLERDGKPFAFSLSVHQEDEINRRVALLLQQQLLEIGVRVTIRPLPLPSLNQDILGRNYEALLLEFDGRETSGHNYKFFHSSQIEEGFNFTSYRNPRVDALLEEAQASLEPALRRQLYHQFQRELWAEPPGAFLFWREMLVGVHRRFRGVTVSAGGFMTDLPRWYVPKEEQKY